MRKLLMIAGLAALACPSLVAAQGLHTGPPDAQAAPRLGESGYQDGAGDAVGGPVTATAPSADTFGADVAFTGLPAEFDGLEAQTEQRIRSGQDRGALTTLDADSDRGRLSTIRDLERQLRSEHDGLSDDDRTNLTSQLDDLNASVNAQWGN